MYGFTLILTLAVVGGAIAYIGDRLGMNVGRKKLTLFGLRPKHTSILVTIVTGVLIATASIAVLSIASQDVRTALFNMKEIQEELRGLQKDYAEMKGQRDAANEELQEAELKLAQAESSYAAITAELELAQQSVEALNQERAFLEAEVAELAVTAEQLSWLYDLVETAFGQIRAADIAFNASEVILTTVIEPGLSREEVRAALENFLLEVDDVAYRRSARAGDSDPYRAIYLPPGVIDLVVEDVLLARGTVIVRAVSEANSIPGVPVRVYLENYMDQMVFSKGTVLASSTWDPKGGVEIDLVILQILNQANNAALNAGVALSPERRGAVLLPGGYFFDAIEASREIEQPVEIRLVVAEDSWRSTSPVLLNLEMVF
ncbi:MAG TPA: DUF3084 domain-containing protein [Firmicutes bacterium]|jgi:uncharacterized protein (DUF3084 family)|nr:DUF3084 domain-containing protein [Bacillota bacterium]HHT42221.1 DUF3084 domain-containing protein [Bacillota bacterium]